MVYRKTLEIASGTNIDSPIQIWIPIPISSEYTLECHKLKPRFSIEKFGFAEERFSDELYVRKEGISPNNIFKMVYLEIPNDKEKIKVNLEFEYTTSSTLQLEPQDYWEKIGLEETNSVDYNHKFVLELAEKIENLSIRNKIPFSDMAFLYLARFLEYEENPTSRVASQVAKVMRSDCGGYHSLLCSLERIKGNPALLAFGFWGNMDEVYHTTAFILKDGLWQQRDLNDKQDNNGILTPFVPISIGTEIEIKTNETPEFPRQVEFLQHSLVWIEGAVPKSIKKEFKLVHN